MLGMFEETMSMLPFASRADMVEAMAKVDEEKQQPTIARFNGLLATLRAEHNLPAAREQLKKLWTLRIREFSEEEPAQAAGGAGQAQNLGKALTPPPSRRPCAAADGAGDGGPG